MNKSENKYDILKSAYDFLNCQISMFEKTVEIQTAQYQLLEEIGEYTKARTVQLTRFQDGEYLIVNEWSKARQHDAKELSEGISLANYEGWTKRLLDGECIYMENREHIKDDLRDAYEELKEYNIQSICAFPVMDDHKMIGLISIHDPDKDKIKGIQEIYEVLGNWLGYRLVKNDNRVLKILSGLGEDYTAAYMINLETDYFEVIINQKTNNAAKQKKELTFTQYLNKYCDTYVIDKDCEAMKRALCKESVKKQFEKEDEFHFSFETIPNEIGQTCFQAHAVKEYGEDGKYAVIGFRCIDEILKREWQYQKELDKAYQMATKQLDIITAAIPGGIKISNDDDKYSFRYVSEQYAQMLGYTVDEFMEASGGTIVGIAHPDDLEKGIAEALRQYEHGDHYEITYRMKCKDGSYKYIEDHGHKVRSEDGRVEHWNLILDKNELIEKTIALESEKKANAAKTTFLTRMSHDIRTPLNGLIGLMDISEKHKDDHALVDRNRKKARIAADHLLSLINDILELNKLGDEEVTLNEEIIDAKKLIHEVKTITEMKAAENGILLKMQSKNMKHRYIKGSPLHIQQIFINIITNAIKYNKTGGKVNCFVEEIRQSDEKAGYKVVVEDNGIGIHKDFLDNIFKPFTQESQDARSVYQGTGLGMSIVKNLVDRMGGTIDIQSEAGIGTRVEIFLAFPIVDEKKVQKQEKKETMRKNLSGIKVLLVEDNELNREIAKFILEDENMIVTEAKDGQEALDIFKNSKENTFDLILMDIMMPVLNGLEAAREIRNLQREDASKIPIFAMTANAFVEDKEKAEEAGMNEHISKPIDINVLIDKIAQYC